MASFGIPADSNRLDSCWNRMGSLYDELRDFSNNDAKVSAESSIGTIALVIFYEKREKKKRGGKEAQWKGKEK